ncbi:MAG: zinc-dependent alcohol dehydrogenase family protein [Gammaproteobacteria bacterium]|nr:zinc-dependent alcohol dehydrogenase family protein [Gammaproteobacteria bacterium]
MYAQILHECKPITEKPLVLTEVERPVTTAESVLIKVQACGICRTDLHVVEGELDAGRYRFPLIPGHQVVGTIESAPVGSKLKIGQRVGVPWLNATCGGCRFCQSGRENLCDSPEFTGWTRNGGFAEYLTAPADFAYRLPQSMSDTEVAPLLCAGIIGYRCLRQCELENWAGAKLGIYGFGAAGHIAIQIARHRGADVYVCTRDRDRHQKLAEQLGATWVGDTFEHPPVKLDASIVFAPAGDIVPAALKALDRDGRLVLGGIHMSAIPQFPYQDIYWERVIRSVANNTRQDGREFLAEAARANIQTHTELFPLADANKALLALKHDAIKGAGVLVMDT